MAQETQQNTAAQKEAQPGAQTAYPQVGIRSLEEAVSLRNPRYSDWLAQIGDPRAYYKSLLPDETAEQQRSRFMDLFHPAACFEATDASRVLSFANLSCPLTVPKRAKIQLPPYIRKFGHGQNNPDYAQFVVEWEAEWIGNKHRRTNIIQYNARYHSNTRATKGEPPTFVIDRHFNCHYYRLLAEGESVMQAISLAPYNSHIMKDAGGNFWISEEGCRLASMKRREPDAEIILKATHHPVWPKKLDPQQV